MDSGALYELPPYLHLLTLGALVVVTIEHFHVMNRPLSLASNGLPYLVDSFTILGQTAGTAAFDKAEVDGQSLADNRFDSPVESIGTLPLDQIVVDFD